MALYVQAKPKSLYPSLVRNKQLRVTYIFMVTVERFKLYFLQKSLQLWREEKHDPFKYFQMPVVSI